MGARAAVNPGPAGAGAPACKLTRGAGGGSQSRLLPGLCSSPRRPIHRALSVFMMWKFVGDPKTMENAKEREGGRLKTSPRQGPGLLLPNLRSDTSRLPHALGRTGQPWDSEARHEDEGPGGGGVGSPGPTVAAGCRGHGGGGPGGRGRVSQHEGRNTDTQTGVSAVGPEGRGRPTQSHRQGSHRAGSEHGNQERGARPRGPAAASRPCHAATPAPDLEPERVLLPPGNLPSCEVPLCQEGAPERRGARFHVHATGHQPPTPAQREAGSCH